ncbi:MAG: hypothetical protein HBSAPP02_10800 [Phycisphaerae bacterium]|nr:MAG: DinB family protein [Planctomycetia bacterium]RIK68387.1 MAG: hypothetical protein DCC66_10550 [Planctomycetota bacterium]GJQ26048.1 MAG: hypothetical protein HBSAPP02_10800 [Phycisphaerae bacterium]
MNVAELLANRLHLARQWTLSLLGDLPESSWYDCPIPDFGHVAWQVAHLAVSQIGLVHVRCFGKSFTDFAPEPYLKLFGRASRPTNGPAGYPSLGEIKTFFHKTQDSTLQLIRSMDDAMLSRPTAGDPHPMFSDCAGAAAMAGAHETFHGGQIAMIRRMRGLAPLR